MEQPRDLPVELLMSLRAEMAELRSDARHLADELDAFKGEIRVDIRRLDDRFFKLMVAQFATLVAVIASFATALVTAISS